MRGSGGAAGLPLTPFPFEEVLGGPRHVADHLVERLEVLEHLPRRLVHGHGVDDLGTATAAAGPGGRHRAGPVPLPATFWATFFISATYAAIASSLVILPRLCQASLRGAAPSGGAGPGPNRPRSGPDPPHPPLTTCTGRWGPRSRAGGPGSAPPSPACSSCRSAASPRRTAGTSLRHRKRLSAAAAAATGPGNDRAPPSPPGAASGPAALTAAGQPLYDAHGGPELGPAARLRHGPAAAAAPGSGPVPVPAPPSASP